MTVEIRRETAAVLAEYATIPIAFEVREVVDVAALHIGSGTLPVRAVSPRIKDYDALPNNGPASWPTRYDVAAWTFLVGCVQDRIIAGAVVMTEPSDVIALGGRADNGLLWDLRVVPVWRRHGVGRALLAAAQEMARQAGARALDIETQDTNVPACRLYASSGFTLADVDPHGYGIEIDEAKLLWTKSLRA